MNRRGFLVGIAGVTVGVSSTLGTAAFSNTQVNRSISVSIENDENAYLRLSDTVVGIGDVHSSFRNGMITFTFGEVDGAIGAGLGEESRYRFPGVFVAENQGTKTVHLYGEYAEDAVETIQLLQSSQVNEVSDNSEGTERPITKDHPSDPLEPGDTILVGLLIDTSGTDIGTVETSVKITAKATED